MYILYYTLYTTVYNNNAMYNSIIIQCIRISIIQYTKHIYTIYTYTSCALFRSVFPAQRNISSIVRKHV